MLTKLKDFFIIPSAIQSEFQQDSLQKNKLSLWLISIMIFGMELFNLARVLFFSQSGLGTLNNRIYFSMYCVLLLELLFPFFCNTSCAQHRYGRNMGCRLVRWLSFSFGTFCSMFMILYGIPKPKAMCLSVRSWD